MALDSVGGMFGLYFASHTPQNYAIWRVQYRRFSNISSRYARPQCRIRPDQHEAGFVYAAHAPELIDETIAVAHKCSKKWRK